MQETFIKSEINITRYEEGYRLFFIESKDYEQYLEEESKLSEKGIECFPIYGDFDKLEKLNPQPEKIYHSTTINPEEIRQRLAGYKGKIISLDELAKESIIKPTSIIRQILRYFKAIFFYKTSIVPLALSILILTLTNCYSINYIQKKNVDIEEKNIKNEKLDSENDQLEYEKKLPKKSESNLELERSLTNSIKKTYFENRIKRKTTSGDLYPNEKGELHIIGVYEGKYPNNIRHSMNYHPSGSVKVSIEITATPIILVLCSYEPVKWEITLDKESKIKKIILGGYYDQEVTGIPDRIPVYKDEFFAYKQDYRYEEMINKLKEFTDLTVSSFQGEYSKDSFVIDNDNYIYKPFDSNKRSR